MNGGEVDMKGREGKQGKEGEEGKEGNNLISLCGVDNRISLQVEI